MCTYYAITISPSINNAEKEQEFKDVTLRIEDQEIVHAKRL
jgi:hypothetical protein